MAFGLAQRLADQFDAVDDPHRVATLAESMALELPYDSLRIAQALARYLTDGNRVRLERLAGPIPADADPLAHLEAIFLTSQPA